MTLESFEKIDAENQLVVIGEKLEETSIKDLSSFSFDPSMLIPKFESCSDLKKDSSDDDGLYTLWSNDQQKFIPTLCKFDTTGSYAVMQSRVKDNEMLEFIFMTEKGFQDGFGSSSNEFWLGLERISEITRAKRTLKIILSNEQTIKEYRYEGFKVTSKNDGYRLDYDFFSNVDESDLLSLSKERPFYTYSAWKQTEQSFGCMTSGAWWFHCEVSKSSDGFASKHIQSNLNGVFSDETKLDRIFDNRWESWPYNRGSFTRTQMLISN